MAVKTANLSTGRRKEAVARVRLVPGSGEFSVNARKYSSRRRSVVTIRPLKSSSVASRCMAVLRLRLPCA